MYGIFIVVALILIYVLILYVMHRRGAFKNGRFSLFGPFLMVKTSKGKGLIDKLAKPKRFWEYFGNFAIFICFLAMVSITIMLLFSAFAVSRIPVENAPTPDMILGIPGLNPLIPLWYGIFALVISIVIHEFCHGILTRVANLKVKALGLLFFVIPLGAFVEPDEEGMKKMPRKKRMRLFAAGPAINIIVALVCALIFSWGFMGSVVAKQDGVVVAGVLKDSPNVEAGLVAWTQIVSMEGERIESIDDFLNFDAPMPAETVNITISYRGATSTIDNATSGVFITSVSRDYPAYGAGLRSHMIIAEINGTTIRTQADLSDALGMTRAGQNVNITIYQYNNSAEGYVQSNTSAVLADKYAYFDENAPSLNRDEYMGKGFLGINSAYLGVVVMDVDSIPRQLTHPFSGVDSFDGFIRAGIYYISLPFPAIGLSPLQSPTTDLYEVSGPLSVFPPSIFWPLANIFYWLFWINLMLGVTNTMPAVPLDGGYLFRDGLDAVLKRLKKDMKPEARERMVGSISVVLAFLILFLIIWVFIGPYIGSLGR
jgi:membrane-associated protease RseP (regulator of RpoE activity)